MDDRSTPTAVRRTIGIDVGGTKTLGVLVERGPDGVVVVDREQVPSDAARPEAVDAILRVARALLDRHGGADGDGAGAVAVDGVGVGLAGFVDPYGVVRSAPNSVGLVGQDVRGRLERELGVPAVADNDANCAVVAAHAVSAPDARHLVAVTFGTGIGGGLIVDGKLVHGARGFAGEPGHMVVDPSGPRCPCGQHGCWERYASGSGLAWLARTAVERGEAPGLAAAVAAPADLRGEHVTALVAEGDPGAVAVFETYAGWVALGVANLIMLLDPDVVVLGGGVIATGEELLGRVRRIVAERFPAASDSRHVPIVASPGGPEAGALGAALLVHVGARGGWAIRG
ncbi:ROK family protein [Dermatobacter hominis]|uniref:ROK family protein n=1 Tax=Dermatobacter hominis TaxID=2884263 RepID=UPI001D0F8EE0|nr:ROK family protein [Dermatobacter hominis]UDY35944.1 ROK family protein [Dermatobacter hominis]